MRNRRVDRPKAQPAPSIPNFGFAGLPKKPEVLSNHFHGSSGNDRSKRKRFSRKKQKTNQLGLTPKADIAEDSDATLEDEEESFAKSGKP